MAKIVPAEVFNSRRLHSPSPCPLKEDSMNKSVENNIQEFLKLVKTAGAITLDDGALLTGGNDVEAITGDPNNELVRFSWTDGENDFSAIFTEGGIANGSFKSDGKFVCEDHEGAETEFSFFEVQPILGSKTAEKLRQSALLLLEQANKLDGLKPYAVVHEHAYGTSAYMCWTNTPDGLTQEEAKVVLDSEFEEDRDEVLTIQDLPLNELTGVQGKPIDIAKNYIATEKSHNEAVQHAKTKGDWSVADLKEVRNYNGKILAVTDHHVVQSLGKAAVIHEKKNLNRVPEKDEVLNIAYDGKDQAKVEPKSQDKGVSR